MGDNVISILANIFCAKVVKHYCKLWTTFNIFNVEKNLAIVQKRKWKKIYTKNWCEKCWLLFAREKKNHLHATKLEHNTIKACSWNEWSNSLLHIIPFRTMKCDRKRRKTAKRCNKHKIVSLSIPFFYPYF